MGLYKSTLLTACLLSALAGCSKPSGDASKQAETPVTAAPAVGLTSTGDSSDTQPDRLELPESAPPARLPQGIAPTLYRLHLNIDPRLDRFSGSSSIDIELTAATDFLWMHGKSLEVSSARAVLEDGKEIHLTWTQASAQGVARLGADQLLPAGKATLHFEYEAPFDTSLEGLYKVEDAGKPYAFTQFEATSARLAFPSFDEPAFKVPFDISLTIPEAYAGITNTPQLSEEPAADGTRKLNFARTKPLPTYLIAFAVGPFDIVEWEPVPTTGLRDATVPLRGITTQGKGDEIRYALENTAAIVMEMEHYFDTPYPYAKLDIIAVPDFSAGAMENAGAITYREQLILLDESAPVHQQHGFFVTHAHELAHQWFGNLVTPVWWDDIWLNEAFATWNSYIVLDRLFPEKKYREALQNISSGVMRHDSLASARQIREPIVRHEDIASAFNGITYRKGGGVLSMFESFLGSDNFRDGIRYYMKAYAFGNTTADDFITAIAQANPQVDAGDLRAAFSSYIEQAGLPLLSAELDCTDATPRVRLSQQRYLPAGSEGSSDQSWIVPVCVSTLGENGTGSECFLLREPNAVFDLKSEQCPQAIMPNTGGNSYYRWSLPPEQWLALMQEFAGLNTNEQISVANSLSAALNNGSMGIENYFAVVPRIIAADAWRVAMAPGADLDKIREFVANERERTLLADKLVAWYQPQLDRLDGLAERDADQARFRAQVMSTLALAAQDPVVRARMAAAGAAFVGFEQDEKIHPEAVDPNLRLLALTVAIEEYGKPYADLLWRQLLASSNALLRQDMLYALGYSRDPVVASVMRDRILAPELKDNEIYPIIYGQGAHRETRDALWDWIQTNMWAVMDRIPSWNRGKLPGRLDSFCSREKANDMENFFAPVIDELESGPRYLANALETIRLCAEFVDLHRTQEER